MTFKDDRQSHREQWQAMRDLARLLGPRTSALVSAADPCGCSWSSPYTERPACAHRYRHLTGGGSIPPPGGAGAIEAPSRAAKPPMTGKAFSRDPVREQHPRPADHLRFPAHHHAGRSAALIPHLHRRHTPDTPPPASAGPAAGTGPGGQDAQPDSREGRRCRPRHTAQVRECARRAGPVLLGPSFAVSCVELLG